MDKSDKDRLLEYAMKMCERGDFYSNILHYLDNQGADKETKREIIQKVGEYRKTIQAKDTEKDKKKYFKISYVIILTGVTFFVLTMYLWNFGIIAFPWSLIGVIIGGRALVEIVKIFVNFFR